MSVLADLRDYEKRVIERLNELKPLVDEYQELEELATRLGLERSAPAAGRTSKPAGRRASRASSSGRAPAARRRPPAKRSGARRAPGRKPQRREQMMELVTARPGITVPEIAAELGVDPTGLYRVVRQLEKDGLVTKSGMQLSPKK